MCNSNNPYIIQIEIMYHVDNLISERQSFSMAALKIQYKLFAAMFAWSTLLIVVLALSIQKSLDIGMIDYVNQREVENIMPLVEILGNDYLKTGNWEDYKEHTNRFKRLLEKVLFTMGPPMGPHHHSLQRKQDQGRPRQGRPIQPGQGFKPATGPESQRSILLQGYKGDSQRARDSSYMTGESQQERDLQQVTNPQNNNVTPLPKNKSQRPPFQRGRPGPLISYVLLDKNKDLVAGYYPPDREYTFVEIKPLSDIVGYFAVSKRTALADGYELKFLDQQQEQLVTIGTILLLVTFFLTLPFARHLVSPIKQIASSLSMLSKGNYDAQLSTKRRDEFQLLFQNINNLAKTLAENESARKKWFADTAHDLRTPIAIMRGELEAMLDGVRKLDTTQIQSIHSETLRLQRFINDLHELARSELGTQHYHKQTIDLKDIILDVTSHCQQLLSQHQINLSAKLPDGETLYFADEFRLAQCLDNLMTNIANYAHGASVAQISMEKLPQSIKICIEDDGVGVEEQHLSKLFDHLYRVECSRNRGSLHPQSGGSGLGLAICKNIIIAHNGSIYAEESKLGGLAIVITLPV